MSVRTSHTKRAAAALVLVATLVACETSTQSASPDAAASAATEPTTTTVSTPSEGVELHYTETEIAAESGTMAVVPEGVWVLSHNSGAAFLVTPEGTVAKRVSLPSYGTVASDHGDVWEELRQNPTALYHVDPATLDRQGRWNDLPIEDVLVRFGAAWASGGDGKLYRARPGQPDVATFETGGVPWPWVAMTDTAVWTLGGSHLQRIDPTTEVITDESALLDLAPGPVKGMSASGPFVVLSTGDHLAVIDPDAGRLVGTVDPPEGYVVVSWYAARDAGNGRFWVGLVPDELGVEPDPSGGGPDTRELLVDAASAQVVAWVTTPFPEDFQPAADGGLWVAPLRDRRVLHVSPDGIPA
jgi:hypothetical protein